MKMASASTFILVLLGLLASSKGSSELCDVYAAPGGTVTVPLQYKLESDDMLKWQKNNIIIFSRKGKNVLSGKAEDVSGNGSLILKNVKKDDEALYTPEVFKSDGSGVKGLKSWRLCVMEPLKKAEVMFACKKGKVTLTCNHDPKVSDVMFAWLENNKVLPNTNKATLQRTSEEVEGRKFSCRVSNKVSQVDSKAVDESCRDPNSDHWYSLIVDNIWFFVGGGAGVVLLLIIVVIVCIIRNRRRRNMRMADEMELRLNYTNAENHQHLPPQQQHPPLPRERQQNPARQQPAGHTGPRQNCSRHQRQRGAQPPNGQPQPSPRKAAEAPKAANQSHDEVPPPLPQPRKKGPRTQQH